MGAPGMRVPEDPNRALGLALLASLALHLALFLALPLLREAQHRTDAREPILARLSESPKRLASAPSPQPAAEPATPVAMPETRGPKPQPRAKRSPARTNW